MPSDTDTFLYEEDGISLAYAQIGSLAQAIPQASLESAALRLRDKKVHVRHETAQQLMNLFRSTSLPFLTKSIHAVLFSTVASPCKAHKQGLHV